ncbi:hypothetical protein Tco_1141244, partial [Tanacetum coccineum]
LFDNYIKQEDPYINEETLDRDEKFAHTRTEAVGSGTREYITRRSKRVADAVEAAMEDKHGPDTS